MIALAKTAPGPDRFALVEREELMAGPGDVLIEVAAAGVCGSDLHLWRGALPHVERAYPMWLGHEYTGTVVRVGSDVDEHWLGRRVTAEPSAGCGACWACEGGRANLCPNRRFDGGGFAPFVRVPATRLHELPDGVPMEVGALAEPLACIVHGLTEVVHVTEGETCVVLGPGPLGTMCALVLEAQGALPLLVGRASSAARLDLARSLRLPAALDHEAADRVSARSGGRGADLVVGCAGGSGALAAGLELLRPGGRYLELALGSPPVSLSPDLLAIRELHLSGAIGHTPTAWRSALALLAEGRLDPRRLARIVTGRYPLHEWQAAFAAASDRSGLKVIVEPPRSVERAPA